MSDPNFIVQRFDNTEYQVVTEQIGDIFNHATVANYLAKTFPQKVFTMKKVDLAYYIMSIIIQKAGHVERMNDYKTCFCYDDSGKSEGKESYLLLNTGKNGLEITVNVMFSSSIIFVPCYGIDQQDNEKVDWKKLPQFKIKDLCELMQDKNKLRVFFDFWRNVPDYKSVFTILHCRLNLPTDISNLIMCMAAKKYG